MLSDSSVVLIVGKGAAGIGTAESLRAEGYGGQITIVSDEVGAPYDRPPLSKEVITGAWAPERARLMSQSRLDSLKAESRLGIAAAGLNVDDHVAHLADGSAVPYNSLVVATGVRPRQLPHENLKNVFVLRTLEHSVQLKFALSEPDAKLVIIGAGFLGLEVAASARLLGAKVTLVEPNPGVPLTGRVGPAVAKKLLALHERSGVRFLTGVGVVSLTGSMEEPSSPFVDAIEEPRHAETVKFVHLTDGTVLQADVVLLAIGSDPNVEWLTGSGLLVDNGLVCDEWCSAGEDVWAAGDVARWLHRGVGRHVRLEHRANATEQGRATARNMVGRREPFMPVPFFWTDHYDVKIQFAGLLSEAAEFETVTGTVDSESFVQRVYDNGTFVGVLGWNAPRETLPHRAELGRMAVPG